MVFGLILYIQGSDRVICLLLALATRIGIRPSGDEKRAQGVRETHNQGNYAPNRGCPGALNTPENTKAPERFPCLIARAHK